jgi:hypothetical protein
MATRKLQFDSGDVWEAVPPPNYREANRVPQRSDGGTPPISAFDSAGRCVSVPIPGRITPAPPSERLERRETPIPAVRMPPDANYDARFKPGESSIISVPQPGLQPGESGPGSIPSKL